MGCAANGGTSGYGILNLAQVKDCWPDAGSNEKIIASLKQSSLPKPQTLIIPTILPTRTETVMVKLKKYIKADELEVVDKIMGKYDYFK